MKKLGQNRAAATAILIIVAIIAVPLLGGMRLALANGSIEKDFAKTVKATDRHGNDLYSDTDKIIIYAKSILEEGTRLAADDISVRERGDRLQKAIDECSGANGAIARYTSSEALTAEARQFLNALRGSTSDQLTSYKAELESQSKRIERVYRQAYTDMLTRRDDLLSGFPAAQIAALFGIGGGK